MATNTPYAFNGTAYIWLGAFNAAGDALTGLGEQNTSSIPFAGSSKGFVRNPSGHNSAVGAVDYGRVAGLTLEPDTVTDEVIGLLFSAAEVTAEGNVKMHTRARAVAPVSALVVPSSNIGPDGKAIDKSQVHWLPFLTDDADFVKMFKQATGNASNSPIQVTLAGLVDATYAGAPLPAGMHNYFKGDPADEGVDWGLPAEIRPAAV